MCINGNNSIFVNSFVAVFAWSMFFVPAASFFFFFLFQFYSFFLFVFCYVFFCILAKLRLAMHDASASTHSRALVDKKLQISIRKARSLQDRMQHQQLPQPLPPPACHPPQGGTMAQSTRQCEYLTQTRTWAASVSSAVWKKIANYVYSPGQSKSYCVKPYSFLLQVKSYYKTVNYPIFPLPTTLSPSLYRIVQCACVQNVICDRELQQSVPGRIDVSCTKGKNTIDNNLAKKSGDVVG